jgi:DNA helicase-2/ATP-dependent DNA helicase PcrA
MAARGVDPVPTSTVHAEVHAEVHAGVRGVVASWDRDLEALLHEARGMHHASRVVEVPSALSATATLRLLGDTGAFAAELARPMPRPPAPAARRGTRFHTWVEEHFRTRQLDLADLDDPGSLDDPDAASYLGDLAPSIADDELAELRTAFLAGPFADRRPVAIEAPFGITLGGLVVRGRIDAVYATDDGGYLVVDWKTGRRAPDVGQLAIYRVAWAELMGVPEESVRAAFYVVPTGEVDEPAALPGRDELERDLTALRSAQG